MFNTEKGINLSNSVLSVYKNSYNSFMEEEGLKVQGQVKSFNEKGGYGFLVNSHNQVMFVYRDDIISPSNKILFVGEKVSYDVTTNQNGQQKAVKVKVV
ncbi:cold shock domain-containing protein [Enterococcus dispar]|nr:cold shock domain-containing protein [Enterococcus dispar]